MKTINIERLAQELAFIEDDVRNVNCGGCGVVAAALYDELSFRELHPDIVVICDAPEDFHGKVRTDELQLLMFDSGKIGWSHIVVRVAGIYHHAMDDGIYARSETEAVSNARNHGGRRNVAEMDRGELEEMLHVPAVWNPEFDRIRYAPVVRDRVAEAVENSLEECPS